MSEPTPPLPGLSPVNGKTVIARFDGGSLSSEAGPMALREVEHRRQRAPRRPGVQDGDGAGAGGAGPLLAAHYQPP